MGSSRGPVIEIRLGSLLQNVSFTAEKCHQAGISLAGVVKGMAGDTRCALTIEKGGADYIASSRLCELRDAKQAGVRIPTMSLRVSMISEVTDVVKDADYSLESDLEVLKALNAEAVKQGLTHNVILMKDIGDLREGWWEEDEFISAALYCERELPAIHVAGIGTNVGCYGSVVPTCEKLKELTDCAEKVEGAIGRKLEIISGGASSSFVRVLDGDMPEGINNLRIGEGLFLPMLYENAYAHKVPQMKQDVAVLSMEILEVRDKPTYPVGELGVDAFSHKPVYVDRGIRKRALAAGGRADYGFPDEIIPLDEGISLIGASSDHTILDIEDCTRDLKPGGRVSFYMNYLAMLTAAGARDVSREYIE
ncbi:MAG: alanine racemase [Lachnospiraceae bacterium]|nr:alanine racemase [Lachnospiraceae bacterium]